MKLKKGEIIFRQNEHGDQAFLIEKGQVEIFYTHENAELSHLAMLNEGEIFGEMALIDSDVRSASAKAFTDCELMIISKEQLLDKLDASDPTIRLIMRMLLNRLRLKNRAQTYQEAKTGTSNNSSLDAIEKLKFENQINDAFKNNEFVIFHQPIIDFSTREIKGSEALIRWKNPNKGLISPGVFIDTLENSSMIIPVGYWIIEECFRHSLEIKNKFPELDFNISINISGRQFSNNLFIENLKKLVSNHSINPSLFKLEVTERVLMEGGTAVDILNECRKIGFEISLDDFGTGFSSLQYLPMLPLNYLKIDRSFVMNAHKSHKTLSVVKSIIQLAANLQLKVIAEGIETTEEEELMKNLGAHFGQGYLYSKPIPFEKLISQLGT